MQFINFIGFDISKETLDYRLVRDGQALQGSQFENTPSGIGKAVPELMEREGCSAADTLIILEHTGMYCLPLVKYLQKAGLKFWLESSVQIKRSMGLVRGKNDQLDATRIAMYGYRNRDAVKCTTLKRDTVERLGYLVNQRDQFIQAKKAFATPLGEQKRFLDRQSYAQLASLSKPTIRHLDGRIKKVEKCIQDLITTDEHLNELQASITSVDGIGPVTAAYMIVTTNEFKNIKGPKEFACYAGVAPFEHTSGSSIRGRTRVSPMANKKMKTLLHLAAMSAIRMPGELGAYYKRKKAAGKHHLSVINAVRAKLVHRVFACVNQQRCYQKNYSNALVNP